MLDQYHIAALCVAKPHEDRIQEFITTLNAALITAGWRLFIYATGSDLFWQTKSDAGEETIYEMIDYSIIDALLFLPDNINHISVRQRLAETAHAHGVPVLVVGDAWSDPYLDFCSHIRFNCELGIRTLTEHLITEHHRTRFHFMAGIKDHPVSTARKQAFADALAAHGIPFDPEADVSYGDFWTQPTEAATRRLLEREQLPDAIVCANDSMAMTVCVILEQAGISVPDTISVTGFDGIRSIYYHNPQITSAECCYDQMGNAAADLLIHSIAPGKPPIRHTIAPQYHLLQSCGCPECPVDDKAEFLNEIDNIFTWYLGDAMNLQDMTTSILACENFESIRRVLIVPKTLYDLTVMLNQGCTNVTGNPLERCSIPLLDQTYYTLIDTDTPDLPHERLSAGRSLIHNLSKHLGHGDPLIFAAIHYIDVPLGYVCFHFHQIDKSNLLKVTQSTAFLSTAIGGFRSVQYSKHLLQQVEDLYQFDSLTGLYNRNRFLRLYQSMLMQEPAGEVTLILCDLDGLKYINDTFSHQEGDRAISVAADAVKTVCRNGICARFGGDEMIALMTEPCDPKQLRADILQYIDRYNQTSLLPYQISASVGFYSGKRIEWDTMFAIADEQMYADKRNKPYRRTN